MNDYWYSVSFASQYTDAKRPPDEVRHLGFTQTDEAEFAKVLAGAIQAMRALEDVWDNGRGFGGYDTAAMAAHLLVRLAERELSPGGLLHFPGGEAEEESEGYAERMAALRRLMAAAEEYVAKAV